METIRNWKVALYIRLSREDGDKSESDSVTNQRLLLKDYVATNTNFHIVAEHIDDGFSGVDFNRPAFLSMMEDIKAGLVDCVICKDLSRFGRNWIESGKYIEQIFPYMGVRFIAINDNYDSLIAQTTNDNISLPFKNLINDAYAGDISIKIRSQLSTKRKKGDFIGAFAVYGYCKSIDNKNKLVIDDFAAGVVRDIFKWRIEGASNQGISERLNEMGILSPYEYKRDIGLRYSSAFKKSPKCLWSPVAIGRILTNEVYIGVMEQGKRTSKNHKVKERINRPKEEWVRIEETHEPIVSLRDFNLVAELLKHDVRIAPGKDEVYLFSGIIKCADCNQNMVRKLVPSGNKKFAYYVCSTHKKEKTCSSHSISEKVLETAVLQSIRLQIERVLKVEEVITFIETLPSKQSDVLKMDKRIDAKEKELAKLNNRKLKLYEDLQDRIIDQEEYVKYKTDYTNQCNEAEEALAVLRKEITDIVNNRGGKHLWIEHFKIHKNIDKLTRGVLLSLVDKIYIRENNGVDIRFAYQYSFESAVNYIDLLESKSFVESEATICHA